jgi:hypothetical protein
MAVGSSATPPIPSYIAFSKEASFGTLASATTAVEAISCSIGVKYKQDRLKTIGPNRGYSKRVQLDKDVVGSIEAYLHPIESVLPVAVALGGGIASSVTAVAGVYTHSITAGNFDTVPSSLSFNIRKGPTFCQQYNGGRVNELKISGAVGEPLKASYAMLFKDNTTGVDCSAILSVSSALPFTFVGGSFRYDATEGSLTSSVAEPIQGFELVVNNNIADGAESRELGTDIRTVLQPTRRDVSLSITQRFDTTTAFNRMIQATQGAVELYFRGQLLTTSGSVTKYYECIVRLPKVYHAEGDPKIGGDEAILSIETALDVVVDNPNTTTGKDIGITFQNQIASY